MVPVDTTAANINGDIPDTTDSPVVVVPRQHGLGVRHQHLGLHLLAGVEVRATTLFSTCVTKNLSNGFWKKDKIRFYSYQAINLTAAIWYDW